MAAMFSPVFTAVLVVIALALFAFGFRLFSSAARQPTGKKILKTGKPGDPGACPVCGVILEPGQQIRSAVFPGKDNRICHIFGCPACLPFAGGGVQRRCPVCGKSLGADGYLIARVFDRPGKKSHVNILGWVNCRNGAHASP